MSTSEQVTTRRETLENSDVPLVITRRLLWSTSGDEVVRRFGYRFLEASEMMESFGVHYRSESSVTGHCAARDHASAQYPVTRQTLPRTQSESYESISTHTCHPLAYSKQ